MHGKSTILKAKLRGENMPVEELEAFLPAVGVTLPEGSSLQGGTLAADLASEGLLENLVTKGTVGLFNTRLIGFDLGAKMAVVAKLAGLKPNAATEIEKLTIDAQATQERIQVNDLLLVVPALGQMRGNGIIGSDSSLDFKMLANLNVSGGVVGSLVSLAGSANSKGLAVPFFIRGTALKPTFVPDVKGATGGLLESFLSGKKSKEGESNQAPSLGNTLRNLLKKKESEKKKGS
jgi:AsmA protein